MNKTYSIEEIQRAIEVWEAFRSGDIDFMTMRRLEELAGIGVYIRKIPNQVGENVFEVILDGGGDIIAVKLSDGILAVGKGICSDPPKKRPEVDMGKVHEGESVAKESFVEKFLRKYDEIVNQKLAAMERLQELVKHGVHLRLDEDGKVVIALTGKFTNKVFPSCDSVIEAVSCVNMEFAREESNES